MATRSSSPSGSSWEHAALGTFGLDPAEVAEFLARRGFGLIGDVSTADAGERYFGPLGRPERGSALYHVVTASVLASA